MWPEGQIPGHRLDTLQKAAHRAAEHGVRDLAGRPPLAQRKAAHRQIETILVEIDVPAPGRIYR